MPDHQHRPNGAAEPRAQADNRSPLKWAPDSGHRCMAYARKGTGTGMCNGVLDVHGECHRAGSHLED